ncbi:MAG: AAA family ATPase, partial [Gammaproteobacteria bacterium]|nr:AAA family ATPase [Gammaproteobacteria bacterium]
MARKKATAASSTSAARTDAAGSIPDALPPEALYTRCDPSQLGFESTSTLEQFSGLLGQDRALSSMQFATDMQLAGFNVFVLGPNATGKHQFVREFLSEQASQQQPPSDWCYVNNFGDPRRPKALSLPGGKGRQLRDDLGRFIDDIQSALPAAFESEDYQHRRNAIEQRFAEDQQKLFSDIENEATRRGIRVLQTPQGIAFAPVKNGEVIAPETFQGLPEPEQRKIQQDIAELGELLQEAMRTLPQRMREIRKQLQQLDREVAEMAVGGFHDELVRRYAALPEVAAHLQALREDLMQHLDLLRTGPESQQQPSMDSRALTLAALHESSRSPAARRYGVNLLVGQDDGAGAPVVFEELPTYQHLVGRVEHVASMGALLTDFHLIKAGALHRANGGYLVLDARKLLMQPFAWEALKQALRSSKIRIESLDTVYSLASTVSIEPEPIPLDVKVVLIGERMIYYLLQAHDPDFSDLFKVPADFDDVMPRTPQTIADLARLYGTLARRESLRPLSADAVARTIEQSSRHAGDAQRISAEVGFTANLIREADFWAGKAGESLIGAEHVQLAIDAQAERHGRIRERMQEQVLRGTVLIDTEGSRIGQINGLAVLQIGHSTFGRPTRISARVALGSGDVIDIEREVELGGPLHSKGVLILSGYLRSQYALERALALSASLVFEQSYGGVDGDSASSAEL